MRMDKYIDVTTVAVITTLTLYNPLYDTYISVFQVTIFVTFLVARESFLAEFQCLSINNIAISSDRLPVAELVPNINWCLPYHFPVIHIVLVTSSIGKLLNWKPNK